MKQAKKNEEIEISEIKIIKKTEVLVEQELIEPELIILCKHCGLPVNHTALIGLSLICPICGKPQNGHPINPAVDLYNGMTILCKHCGKPIEQSKLLGLSLICPLCGKPQNGHPHPKSLEK